MKNKKSAQIKMFETIAILVVFFFLVGFGLIFYSRIVQVTSSAKQDEATILKSIQVAEEVFFLPEIQCSKYGNPEDNCIDLYKLDAFKALISSNKVYYFELFGYNEITINEIYPEKNNWQLYNNPKPSYSDKIQTQFPVAIHNPISDEYSFGVLYVNVYS